MHFLKRLGLKYTLLIIAGALVAAYQLTDTFDKYKNQKPTLEHYMEEWDEIMPPSITICASDPYKQNDDYMMPEFDKEDQEFLNWPDTDVITRWKASTFEFNEILKSITDLNDPENCTLTSIPFQQNKCGMIWKEVNSISDGRCYTIEFIKNVTLDNPLEIILKFYAVDADNPPGLPIVYLHPKHHELSIPYNVWKIDPFVIELQKNKETETTVKSTTIEKHSAKCTAQESYEEYFKCIAEKVGGKIQDCKQWKNHCKDIIPDLICDPKNKKCQDQDQDRESNMDYEGHQPSNMMKSSMFQNSEEDSNGINDFAYCFKFCTIPQAVDFAQSNSEVNYCTNGADAGCVLEIIQANRKYFIDRMDGPNSTTMCPHPCYDIDYSYSKTINSIPSSRHGETWLRLTMSSTEVELTDEFHRMGITDMIASIGGSVVLFTGFSFLEFCVDMIEILVACCCSSKKKNPKNRVSNSADSRITVASAESDAF